MTAGGRAAEAENRAESGGPADGGGAAAVERGDVSGRSSLRRLGKNSDLSPAKDAHGDVGEEDSASLLEGLARRRRRKYQLEEADGDKSAETGVWEDGNCHFWEVAGRTSRGERDRDLEDGRDPKKCSVEGSGGLRVFRDRETVHSLRGVRRWKRRTASEGGFG